MHAMMLPALTKDIPVQNSEWVKSVVGEIFLSKI